jgi:hypothetical protein
MKSSQCGSDADTGAGTCGLAAAVVAVAPLAAALLRARSSRPA